MSIKRGSGNVLANALLVRGVLFDHNILHNYFAVTYSKIKGDLGDECSKQLLPKVQTLWQKGFRELANVFRLM